MCDVCKSDRPIRRILWGGNLCGECSALYTAVFRYQQRLGLKGPVRLETLQKVHSALSWTDGANTATQLHRRARGDTAHGYA